MAAGLPWFFASAPRAACDDSPDAGLPAAPAEGAAGADDGEAAAADGDREAAAEAEVGLVNSSKSLNKSLSIDIPSANGDGNEQELERRQPSTTTSSRKMSKQANHVRQLMVAVEGRRNERVKILLSEHLFSLSGHLEEPLNLAVRQGFRRIANMLLVAKADANATDYTGSTPLTYAIQYDRYILVKILVRHGARLFNEDGSDGPGELLFSRNNTVAIAAAAEGLCHCPAQVETFKPQHVKLFLSAAGRAPLYMMQAIFTQRHLVMPLSAWNVFAGESESSATGEKGEEQVEIDTAYIGGISPTEGPSAASLKKGTSRMDTDDCHILGVEYVDFLSKLAPSQNHGHGHEVPIGIFQCLVPGIHQENTILCAIAQYAPNDEIFNDPGCKALVKMGWLQARKHWIVVTTIQVVNVILLCGFTDSLHENRLISRVSLTTQEWAVICLPILAWNVLEEVAQAVGAFSLNYGRLYIYDLGNVFDWLRLIARGLILVHYSAGGKEAPLWQGLLAAVVFWTWLRLLYVLRVTKTFGIRILPITQSFSGIGGFMVVVGLLLVSFVHMYWALGNDRPVDAFMLVYRLAMLGDFSQKEMGETLPEFWSDFLVVFLGFVMCITILNIFIGVLGVAYDEAYQNAERSFVHERVNVVLQLRASCEGLKRLTGIKMCHCRRRQSLRELPDCQKYLWYARRAEEETFREMGVKEMHIAKEQKELEAMLKTKQDTPLEDNSRPSFRRKTSQSLQQAAAAAAPAPDVTTPRPAAPAPVPDPRVDQLIETVSEMSARLSSMSKLMEAVARTAGVSADEHWWDWQESSDGSDDEE